MWQAGHDLPFVLIRTRHWDKLIEIRQTEVDDSLVVLEVLLPDE
jgi:hypothetical protein